MPFLFISEGMESKSVAIVGAGLSGLIACKYVKEKGFRPTVFEMKDSIGGVWLKTLDSTLLQTPKDAFQFSDFPWPSSIPTHFPTHGQLIDDCWSGEAFGSDGSWHVTVQNAQQNYNTKVHIVDFVIICTGRYGDVPKIPSFEGGKGPEVFNGKVIHAVDLYTMNHQQVDELIKGKKIVVVGFQKSALDIAEKCATINGLEVPCTIICREPKWHLPQTIGWCTVMGFIYGTRFGELLYHKAGESIGLGLLATILSPLV